MNKELKHIKRKFLMEFSEIEFQNISKTHSLETFIKGKDGEKLNKLDKINNREAIIFTNDGYYLKAFGYKYKGNVYAFPEPDPTLVYFSTAQSFIIKINESRERLLPLLNFSSKNIGATLHDLYLYYGSVCGAIVFLMMSLEAFMNSLILEKDKFPLNNKILNQLEIQHLDFDSKIKNAIPILRNLNFLETKKKVYKELSELKVFRDSIVHTKSIKIGNTQDSIIKRSLTFNYDKAVIAVAEYMNFYKPNYIQECNCGKDF